MLHVLAHLAGLLLLAVVIYTSGRLCENRRPLPDPGLRILARWIYGLAWWSAGLFLLAAGGFLSGTGLACWTLLTGLLLRPSTTTRDETESPSADRRSAFTLWAVLFVLTAPLLLIALGPTRSWDAEVYHLSLPQIFVEHGGFKPVEMSVYSHWPLGGELLFAGAMIVQDFVLAKIVHFGFGLLVCLALAQGLDRRRRLPLLGLGAALLFLANDVVLYEMRVAYVDLALTFYLLVQGLFLARAADEIEAEPRRRFLVTAGLAAGLAAGVKVTGGLYAVLVGLLYLPRLTRDLRQTGLAQTLRDTSAFLIPGAALALPWILKTAWQTGNPFYPFFWSSLGGPDWSTDLAARFADWQKGVGMGREPLDYLLLPLRVALFGEHGYATFDGKIGAFWLVAWPLAAVAAWRVPRARGPFAVALALSVFWALSSQQMRFLIPALAFFCRALAVSLDDEPDAAASTAGASIRRAAPLVFALSGVALLGALTEYPRLARTATRYAHIFTTPQFSIDATTPAVAQAIDALPADAKILVLRTNQRFDLRRDLLVDSFYLEASQIADWLKGCADAAAVERRLRARRVSHILVGLAHPERSFPYPPALLEAIADPGRVEVVHRDETHLLLALRPAPDEDAVPR